MAEVFVIDRVVAAPGRAQEFIDAYMAGYAPDAGERGMTLHQVLVSPPIWFNDQPNVVTITWSLPDAHAWWQMTWKGRPDPTVAQWWDSVADLIVERDRSVATAPANVAPAGDAAAGVPAIPPKATTVGVTRLLDVAEPDREQVIGALRAAASRCGALNYLVEPTLAGSRNGGDILVHLRFRDQSAWNDSAFDDAFAELPINHVNGATYQGTPTRRGDGTVYRTLLLRVDPDVDAATIARFEHELASMPRYIPTIAAWQLSRVHSATGTSAWTHVFEQEFTSVDGLMGPYLMHPIHWAVVDRWFDPETTDVIIRDRLCHSFCTLSRAVL